MGIVGVKHNSIVGIPSQKRPTRFPARNLVILWAGKPRSYAGMHLQDEMNFQVYCTFNVR